MDLQMDSYSIDLTEGEVYFIALDSKPSYPCFGYLSILFGFHARDADGGNDLAFDDQGYATFEYALNFRGG